MSIHATYIGQMIRAYTHQAKMRPKDRTRSRPTGSFEDTVRLSINAQRKKRLEELALAHMELLTRKKPRTRTSLNNPTAPGLIDRSHGKW